MRGFGLRDCRSRRTKFSQRWAQRIAPLQRFHRIRCAGKALSLRLQNDGRAYACGRMAASRIAGWGEGQSHGGIAEEDPGAANVIVGDARFGLQNGNAQWSGRIGFENRQKRLVHAGLGRLSGEAGRSPHGDGAAIRREQKRLRQTGRVDVLEEPVQAIHQKVDGQLIGVS